MILLGAKRRDEGKKRRKNWDRVQIRKEKLENKVDGAPPQVVKKEGRKEGKVDENES